MRCSRATGEQVRLMRRFDRDGDLTRAIVGGMAAGIFAGLVLNALMAGMAVASGADVWSAFKGAGAPFLGDRASQPGFDPVALIAGAFGHYLVSIVWGVIFALLAYGFSRGATLVLGLLYGVVVWFGMFFVVLPLVGLGAMTEYGKNVISIASHVLFGFSLALGFLPFQLPRRTEVPPPPRVRDPVYP